MILFLAIALAGLSVPLLGGALSRLRDLHFRDVALVPCALVLQLLVISILPSTLPGWLAESLHLDSYAMVVVFLWRNRKVSGLWLIGTGGLANLAAVSANAGVMPALPSALAAAGRVTLAGRYANSRAVQHPHLQWLGDIFAIPKGWPLANVFSIGDVLLVVGAFVLLHVACRSRVGRLLDAGRGALLSAARASRSSAGGALGASRASRRTRAFGAGSGAA